MDDSRWLEELYRSNYRMLCGVAYLFLGSEPVRLGEIEDEIHEVFVLAFKKRAALIRHPNPEGWLVETLRRRLLSGYRRFLREQKHTGFSLDAQDGDACAARWESLQTAPQDFQALLNKERKQLLEKWLGKENAAVFLAYCVDRVPARELARQCGVTEDCLRMRLGRMKKKLLAHPDIFMAIALWFLLGF